MTNSPNNNDMDAATTETPNTTTDTSSKTDLIPQLASEGITVADMETAVRVLNAVATLDPKRRISRRHQRKQQKQSQNGEEATAINADNTLLKEDGLELYKHSNLRPFRKALSGCLELHKRTMFQGKDEEQHYEERLRLRSVKRQKTAESIQHQKYLANTELRKGRVDRLRQLQQEAAQEEQAKMQQFMIPDGHVETERPQGKLLLNDNTTGSGEAEESSPQTADDTSSTTHLPKLRSCYVCKIRYRELHSFYDQLCPTCAALNWEKRHATVNLADRVAVVTGSRVKIGYQVCLKLLRAGAHVVATTRFPNAAAATYAREPDFGDFQSRLQIYGLDLRDITGMEAFTRFLKQVYPKGIDILINNACQTVRRPVQYYTPLVQQEQQIWETADDTHKALLQGCVEFEKVRRRLLLRSSSARLEGDDATPSARPLLPMSVSPPENSVSESTNKVTEETQSTKESTTKENGTDNSDSAAVVVSTVDDQDDEEVHATSKTPFESKGISHSAAMSQMIILPEDAGVSDAVLPPGVTDINGQQLDLRTHNSWLLKMEQVSTPEVMECMFINAIAPFILNARLKPLMTMPVDNESRPDRYIINVSAMEGMFLFDKKATREIHLLN